MFPSLAGLPGLREMLRSLFGGPTPANTDDRANGNGSPTNDTGSSAPTIVASLQLVPDRTLQVTIAPNGHTVAERTGPWPHPLSPETMALITAKAAAERRYIAARNLAEAARVSELLQAMAKSIAADQCILPDIKVQPALNLSGNSLASRRAQLDEQVTQMTMANRKLAHDFETALFKLDPQLFAYTKGVGDDRVDIHAVFDDKGQPTVTVMFETTTRGTKLLTIEEQEFLAAKMTEGGILKQLTPEQRVAIGLPLVAPTQNEAPSANPEAPSADDAADHQPHDDMPVGDESGRTEPPDSTIDAPDTESELASSAQSET